MAGLHPCLGASGCWAWNLVGGRSELWGTIAGIVVQGKTMAMRSVELERIYRWILAGDGFYASRTGVLFLLFCRLP